MASETETLLAFDLLPRYCQIQDERLDFHKFSVKSIILDGAGELPTFLRNFLTRLLNLTIKNILNEPENLEYIFTKQKIAV